MSKLRPEEFSHWGSSVSTLQGKACMKAKVPGAGNNWAGSTDPQCSSLKHWLIYILQMRKLRREKKRNQTEFQLVGDREVMSISGANAISSCSTLAFLEQQPDEEICCRFRLNPNWDISHHINIHYQFASHFPACAFFFLFLPLVSTTCILWTPWILAEIFGLPWVWGLSQSDGMSERMVFYFTWLEAPWFKLGVLTSQETRTASSSGWPESALSCLPQLRCSWYPALSRYFMGQSG